MKVADGIYVYCAGHGEYLPFPLRDEDSVYLWADPEDKGEDDDERPDWLPDEVAALGWEGDPKRPDGCYIRLFASEATLRGCIEALYLDLISDDLHGDDNAFDYWPSGARLLWQMVADAGIDAAPMRAALLQHVNDIHAEGEEFPYVNSAAEEIAGKAELL